MKFFRGKCLFVVNGQERRRFTRDFEYSGDHGFLFFSFLDLCTCKFNCNVDIQGVRKRRKLLTLELLVESTGFAISFSNSRD